MAKFTHAVTKLQKTGAEVYTEEPTKSGTRGIARKDDKCIEFTADTLGDVHSIRVISDSEPLDEPQSDYFAGRWCDTIAEAIGAAGW